MRIVLAAAALAVSIFQGSAPQERRIVHVTAERFSYTPSRIELESGEAIELVVTSDDTSHGLRIQGTDIDRTIPKRGSGEIRVTVQIDEPGRYTFECSRVCGAGHNFMRGELIVRERHDASKRP
jgi:cytochrome c oxidase subunit II